jgi:hypothetical protein
MSAILLVEEWEVCQSLMQIYCHMRGEYGHNEEQGILGRLINDI